MERETKYIDVNEVQKLYLPISKKKIRQYASKTLQLTKRVGNKILVNREELVTVLSKPENIEIN